MENKSLRRRISALMYIASCAVNGIAPKDVGLLNPEGICAMAAEHTIGALVCHGLELSGAAPQKAVADKHLAIRKTMLFDNARAEILAAFEKANIEYMVLKGVIMKDLYPSIGLRQMSDNDILVDPKHRRSVRKIMEGLGYRTDSYGKRHHDVYIKDPVYNFEIHISLFSIMKEGLHEYFRDALDRAESIDGTLEKRMTDEDFYIYLKAHEYNHYVNGGVGLRALIDTYVFLLAKSDKISKRYIDLECEQRGISEYEIMTRDLADKLLRADRADMLREFALTGYGDVFTEGEWESLEFFATSGTYGKISNAVESAMKKYENEKSSAMSVKIKYLVRRVIPPMDYYAENAPLAYKYKILIPFYCIGRLAVAIVRQPKRIFAQIKSVFAYKKDR